MSILKKRFFQKSNHCKGLLWLLHLFCIIIFFQNFLVFPCFVKNRNFSSKSQIEIKDYQKHLNPRFKKRKRLSTRFIIIHTSEAGLVSTLRTLSAGKKIGRHRTKGGHSHYAIARNGKIFRTLKHKYRADHTGLSMWDGIEDISSHSIGIELVGFHYGIITQKQYKALSGLLGVLQGIYHISDKNVLTHSQISYGRPNLWFRRPHRGRKRCALNFDRKRVGLEESWGFDPDVRALRLAPDPQINRLFYGVITRGSLKEKNGLKPSEVEKKTGELSRNQSIHKVSNKISPNNTAWNIAGEDYNYPTTVYIFPGGKIFRGDKIGKFKGWGSMPSGTQVLVNQPLKREEKKGPIFLITSTYTAWSFAGVLYQKPTTIYFFPNGKIIPGDKIRDWDSIPESTHLIIGYKGPITIESRKGRTPWGIAGKACSQEETIYFIPGKRLTTGDKIKDFNNLPRSSKIFIKMK